ncbi:Xaa-Pro aminopeptidase [Entomortierella parvispora]|uniref:Xaa-Pro aminopeptidase n=1 Tax=Entomortierella parvispora TaxID=205924 RepID=A0A9P3LVQ3_9FUNG|nr:Xaa-Pro aminopeptidase [Entomortierella parvispora]
MQTSRPFSRGPRMVSNQNKHRITIRCASSLPEHTNTPRSTVDRLGRLRTLMKKPEYNITAFVVPSEDAHQSEYVAECDDRRAYISGFTGSAGLAIVCSDNTAALFTDGRYFLQASQELDSNWTLMKSGMPDVPTWQEFLIRLPPGSRIGIDPLVFTATDARKLEQELSKVGSKLVPVPNLIDMIWQGRPSRPAKDLRLMSVNTTGKSHMDKIKALRANLEERGVTGCVVSGLDEVAWLFNMRGSDVHCNPVFFAYAVVTQDSVSLYLQDRAVSEAVRDHLGKDVEIKPYERLYDDLRDMSKRLKETNQKMLLGTSTNLALANALGKENVVEARSPVVDAKAIKNRTELEGIRNCHLRDAAAVIQYFAWLEDQLKKGVHLDEADGAERLAKFRAEQTGYVGPSFDTISSTGPNGAIIHYKPEKPAAAQIRRDAVYLCDSGGQYLDGTTDITRTLHFQQPTEHEKRCFTRVLQGHIAIDTAIFPRGTTGYVLDVLSRRALWSDGLDFRHGTGHGVGAFLNVHEGPHGCGSRPAYNEVALAPGMTLTNEPGYYEDGKFGIRIENVLLVQKKKTRHHFGGKDYLGFEHVTFVPIQTKMIERHLLTDAEVEWVNQYHRDCLEKVAPLLDKGSLARAWLVKETMPI